MWLNLWSFDKDHHEVDDSDKVLSLDSIDVDDDFEPISTGKRCQCQFRENVCTGWKTIPVLLWAVILHFLLDVDVLVNSDSAIWRWNIIGNTIFLLSIFYSYLKLKEYVLHWDEEIPCESHERPRDEVIYTVPVLGLFLLLCATIFMIDIIDFVSLELAWLPMLIIIGVVAVIMIPTIIYYMRAVSVYRKKIQFKTKIKSTYSHLYDKYGT